MKNYTGAVCYADKPFNALVAMFNTLKSNAVMFGDGVVFRMPLKDILQKCRPIGIKYNEETGMAVEAKLRVKVDDTCEVEYIVHAVDGKLYVKGGDMV